jgi:hypothetical protein
MEPDVSFTNLLIISAIAVLAPLVVGFAPRLRVPAVVLEIVAGIVVGPSVLGWVRVDLPVQIIALFGLAFLLFLAGLEIDLHRLRGRVLRLAAVAVVGWRHRDPRPIGWAVVRREVWSAANAACLREVAVPGRRPIARPRGPRR